MLEWCELPCVKIKVKPDAVQCKRTTMKLALSITGITKTLQLLLHFHAVVYITKHAVFVLVIYSTEPWSLGTHGTAPVIRVKPEHSR